MTLSHLTLSGLLTTLLFLVCQCDGPDQYCDLCSQAWTHFSSLISATQPLLLVSFQILSASGPLHWVPLHWSPLIHAHVSLDVYFRLPSSGHLPQVQDPGRLHYSFLQLLLALQITLYTYHNLQWLSLVWRPTVLLLTTFKLSEDRHPATLPPSHRTPESILSPAVLGTWKMLPSKFMSWDFCGVVFFLLLFFEFFKIYFLIDFRERGRGKER